MRRAAAGAVLAAALACGCGDGGGATAAPTASRVDAVTAAPAALRADTLDAFCDVHKAAADARPFAMPALDAPDPPPAPPAPAWRWLNVWATWCKPCVEEIPLLGKWKERLGSEGLPVVIELLSVDEKREDVEAFRKEYPATPPSLRLRESGGMGAFIGALGLDSGASIPIHVFVDPGGKIRCVRTGAVRDTDYGAVKLLLSGA